MHSRMFFVALFGLLSSCGVDRHQRMQDRIRAATNEELRPWRELEQQKASLWHQGLQPEDFEFDDHGTVTVKRWELQGWPGEEYIKARVTYKNTTDEPVVHALVWLEVLDDEGRVHGSSAVRLYNPMGYAVWPGHTVTSELRAPTNGVHKLDGWGWGIACDTLPEIDPGERPHLIVPQIPRGVLNTPYPSQLIRSRVACDIPGVTVY